MQKYVIALYIRLSLEDYKYDSMSIENQHLALNEFVSSMPESTHAEVLEFIDNGYSGTNFERPKVQELIEMVRANKIDCIIVKDFSRFGRNSIETGYFIERVFPRKAPRQSEIRRKLSSMQKVVGGTIQVLYPFEEPVALVCNDEGKLMALPANRALRDGDGKLYDIVCGTFFLCGAPPDSEDFISLTAEQMERYQQRFLHPELFLNLGREILCLPL